MKVFKTVLLYNFDEVDNKVGLLIDRFCHINITCNYFIEGHPSEKKEKANNLENHEDFFKARRFMKNNDKLL